MCSFVSHALLPQLDFYSNIRLSLSVKTSPERLAANQIM
jgi:hypothetical protein